jgi:hypothetical protein
MDWRNGKIGTAGIFLALLLPFLPLLPVPPLLPFQPLQPLQASGTAIIRGRVTLAATGQPVGRADVRASSPTLKTPRAVKTDANGRYEIRDLPAGKYVVSVVKSNFVTAAFGQKRPLGPGAPFDLADGQIAANVNFALSHSGVIAGRVVDEFGDPVTEAQLATLRYQYVNGERRLMPTGGRGTTNDIGEFRLFGLPPGDYFITARLQNAMFSDTDDRSENRTAYAPTFYPGTASVADAQRISIEAGQVVSGITLPLLPVRTVRVSGIALDASGKPMGNSTVMAVNPNAMFGAEGFGQVRADGRFTLSGLTPGDYVLRAGDGGSGGETQLATLPITVGDSDITDVQLVAYRQSTITGRVVFESHDNPPAPSALRIVAARPNPMLIAGGNAVPKDDLTFEMKATPGHALIRANVAAPGVWQLKSVTLNGVDITDVGLEITPNSTIADLVVTMTTEHGELSGIVASVNGETERDCWVIVFSQDSAAWTPLTRRIAATRPGQNNRFQLRMPPGNYYAVAVDNFDVEQGEWTDPTFLTRVRDRAVTIAIADGDKKSLDLRITSSR